MNGKELIDSLLEEEEIGTLFRLRDYKFSIHSPEGSIPHIHFTKGISEKPELSGCLAILYKGYANHGKYKDELPKKIFEYFCSWMSNDDNFKLACEEWNTNNSITKIEYSKIKNPFKTT